MKKNTAEYFGWAALYLCLVISSVGLSVCHAVLGHTVYAACGGILSLVFGAATGAYISKGLGSLADRDSA